MRSKAFWSHGTCSQGTHTVDGIWELSKPNISIYSWPSILGTWTSWPILYYSQLFSWDEEESSNYFFLNIINRTNFRGRSAQTREENLCTCLSGWLFIHFPCSRLIELVPQLQPSEHSCSTKQLPWLHHKDLLVLFLSHYWLKQI